MVRTASGYRVSLPWKHKLAARPQSGEPLDTCHLTAAPTAPARASRKPRRLCLLAALAAIGLPSMAAAQSVNPHDHTPVVSSSPSDTVHVSQDDDDSNKPQWHGLQVDKDYSLGTHFEGGKDPFAIVEGEASRGLTLQGQHGLWHTETHVSGTVGFQVGALHSDFQPGANVTVRGQFEQEAIRPLGNGLRLHLDGVLGVQAGKGTEFEEESPLSRTDVGGTALLEKDLPHGTVSGGPFVDYLHSLDRHGNFMESGFQAGYAHHLTDRHTLEVDARIWHTTSNLSGPSVDRGVYLMYKNSNKKIPQPFIGYENIQHDRRMVGGLNFRF